ncbi:MAG TPA: MarR family transcriptional regulator [Candidatus Binatia bacterium]|nr:MarR family transcriptional regulator [Candidatus Binatia bacterium]
MADETNVTDRARAIFVDGIGAAAATSGVLNQLQGRIFALLYLQDGDRSLSLEEIAAELQQSKSNVSIQIRGLVEWHLVRRVTVPGSRKDHYQAATDLWRVMQEILERRFRWNLRQVLATVAETRRATQAPSRALRAAERERVAFLESRLAMMGAFFAAVDAGIGAFTQGKSFEPEAVQNALRLVSRTPREK